MYVTTHQADNKLEVVRSFQEHVDEIICSTASGKQKQTSFCSMQKVSYCRLFSEIKGLRSLKLVKGSHKFIRCPIIKELCQSSQRSKCFLSFKTFNGKSMVDRFPILETQGD